MPTRDALAAALGLALLALSAVPARAQRADQPIVIEYADELRRVVESDSLVYFLEGNVRARRGPLNMRSQRAVINRTSGVADFTRDVHFWDESNELYADHVVYTEATDVAVADGAVQVIDVESGSNVSADTVRYDRRLGLITAWPRPHGILIPRDSVEQTPFDLYADEMRFISDSARQDFVGVGEVLIERPDLTAIGDSLHYDERAGRVALRQGPQVETEDVFLTADRIDLLLVDNEISSLVALREARTIQKSDSVPAGVPPAFGNVSETSFLEGDSIHVAFGEENVDWLISEGNARSLNYQRQSAPGPTETWSLNYLLARKIRLNFQGDTLTQVLAWDEIGVMREEEVRIGGPERIPSEPIPLPATFGGAVAIGARRPRRRR